MDKEIDQFSEAAGDFLQDSTPASSVPQIRRELDSMDDFEHLEHDSLNIQKENEQSSTSVKNEVSDPFGNNYPGADPKEIINNLVEEGEGAGTTNSSTNSSELPLEGEGEIGFFSANFNENPLKPELTNPNVNVMDSNLIGKFDDFPKPKSHVEDNVKEPMDKYFGGDKAFDSNFQSENYHLFQQQQPNVNVKSATYDFMESEKGIQDSVSKKIIDFDEDKSSTLNLPKHEKEDKNKETFSSVENLLGDDFSDVAEFEQPKQPSPKPIKKDIHEFKEAHSEKFEPKKDEIKEKPKPAPAPAPTPLPKEEKKIATTTTTAVSSSSGSKPANVIEAEIFFCKMGLDTWFNPEKLNPQVESLIYWRDPKKSGPVFGGVLVVLLALTYFSLITVIAYLSLLGLTATISFRIYKNVLHAVQKTGDGHPFKEFLEWDLSLPPEKVKEISEVVVAHLNAGVSALRRLFLVEDLIDSIKFGVFMWALTYVGSWFNGMTLVILAWAALFTLPKVYETNKTQIDANLEIVKSKLAEITSKVKAAIPLGKKEEKEEKKE